MATLPPGCRGQAGGRRRTVLRRKRERDAEMPQLPGFVVVVAGAAVIVVWRGKERVDTTQLSLAAAEERREIEMGRDRGRERGKGRGKKEWKRTSVLQDACILFVKMAPPRRLPPTADAADVGVASRMLASYHSKLVPHARTRRKPDQVNSISRESQQKKNRKEA